MNFLIQHSSHAERDNRQLELKTKLLRAFHVGNLHFHSNQQRENVEKKVKSETARKGIEESTRNWKIFNSSLRHPGAASCSLHKKEDWVRMRRRNEQTKEIYDQIIIKSSFTEEISFGRW